MGNFRSYKIELLVKCSIICLNKKIFTQVVSAHDHQVGGRLAQTGRKGSTMFFSPPFLLLPARGKTKAEGRVRMPR